MAAPAPGDGQATVHETPCDPPRLLVRRLNRRPSGTTQQPSHRELPAASERSYLGERGPGGCRVVVSHGELTLPLQPRTCDPLWSFSWGRAGASARELAWCILFDAAQDVTIADDWFIDFTGDVVAQLPFDAFRLTSSEVLAWLSSDVTPVIGVDRRAC